jgi:hypothetical protein
MAGYGDMVVTDAKDDRKITFAQILAKMQAAKEPTYEILASLFGYIPRSWDPLCASLAEAGVRFKGKGKSFDLGAMLNQGLKQNEIMMTICASNGPQAGKVFASLTTMADSEPNMSTKPNDATIPSGKKLVWDAKNSTWIILNAAAAPGTLGIEAGVGVKKVGQNQTEFDLGDGLQVLFSYNTPVAARVDGKAYRTDKKWSVTTAKHIRQWLGNEEAEMKPQNYFDDLVGRKAKEEVAEAIERPADRPEGFKDEAELKAYAAEQGWVNTINAANQKVFVAEGYEGTPWAYALKAGAGFIYAGEPTIAEAPALTQEVTEVSSPGIGKADYTPKKDKPCTAKEPTIAEGGTIANAGPASMAEPVKPEAGAEPPKGEKGGEPKPAVEPPAKPEAEPVVKPEPKPEPKLEEEPPVEPEKL